MRPRLPHPSAEAAWACFSQAAAAYGLPRQLLSDNHACFSRRHGGTVRFERRLAKAGVQHLTSAPAHPQTLGKLERLHRILKEWLAEQQVLVDLTELQTLLNGFTHHYNHERPHQGIGATTPPRSATAAASQRPRRQRRQDRTPPA